MSRGLPLNRARRIREKRVAALQKRCRLAPLLEMYDLRLAEVRDQGSKNPEIDALSSLTSLFTGSLETIMKQIRAAKPEGIQLQNAVKRSAGTNFQGLCEYALIRWIDTTDLPLNVGCNAPQSMKDELTIYGEDVAGPFRVEPDIDISIWEEGGVPTSPLLLLSAKTSLADRAGQAARWKLYFDIHQATCPHIPDIADCPIHRTKIKVKTKHQVVHAIVTANIYKMNTEKPQGELESGQCRNNTYMFKHKYTTRMDDIEVRPEGWYRFTAFPSLVANVFGYTLTGL